MSAQAVLFRIQLNPKKEQLIMTELFLVYHSHEVRDV